MADLYLSRYNVGKSTYLSCHSLPVAPIPGAGTFDLLEFRTPNHPVMLQFETTFDTSGVAADDTLSIAYRENGVKVLQYKEKYLTASEKTEMWKFGKIIPANTLIKIDCTATGSGLASTSVLAYGQSLNKENVNLFG